MLTTKEKLYLLHLLEKEKRIITEDVGAGCNCESELLLVENIINKP